jgi:hypothetical protein
MTVLDDDINVARHDSTVNVGTWSFDIFVQDEGDGYFYVEFMSDGAVPYGVDDSTFVCVGPYLTEDKFVVWQQTGSIITTHSNIYIDPLQGWHHIDVSRDSSGNFKVWFNGTLESEFVSTVTSSTYFEVYCGDATGCAIDSIIVTDEIPNETTTTTTTPTDGTTPPPVGTIMLIIAGVGVAVVVIALVVVFTKRR